MHLDALCVRRIDQGLQRVEPRRDPFGNRKPRAEAEAIAATHDLRNDGVRVHGLRRRNERIDLSLVEEPFTERIGPERAELARRRGSHVRADFLRDRSERAGDVPKDGSESYELQLYPSPNRELVWLTPSVQARSGSRQAAELPSVRSVRGLRYRWRYLRAARGGCHAASRTT